MPRPAEFGLFARALARRYSGALPDPLPAPEPLSGQRDLPHDRVPAGRDLGAKRRGPGQPSVVRAPYRTVILPVMPGWIVQR